MISPALKYWHWHLHLHLYRHTMGPSRTARLYFLLGLDLVFFVLEITIGQSSFILYSFRC